MSLSGGQIFGLIVAIVLLGVVFLAAKNKF
jgi:hypothetical protein